MKLKLLNLVFRRSTEVWVKLNRLLFIVEDVSLSLYPCPHSNPPGWFCFGLGDCDLFVNAVAL